MGVVPIAAPKQLAGSLPTGKLAGGNKRCVDAKHSVRVQPRLTTGALPEGSAPLTSLLSGGEQTNRGGDLSTPPKRSHIRDKGTREWFPFKHFSGSKKGRRAEASNKPQSPEPVPPSPPLQDGGDSHLEGLSQTRRLADESGFEGCLLHNPNSHLPQEVPQVQLPREDIPVQLPPLRSLFGTMGLYQDPQTSNSHSETVGGTVDSDILILAETKELASEATVALTYLLESLGFIINQKKSVMEPD